MEQITETPDKRMVMFVNIPEWDSLKYQDGKPFHLQNFRNWKKKE
jgi:hypothetical protein